MWSIFSKKSIFKERFQTLRIPGVLDRYRRGYLRFYELIGMTWI